MNIPEFDLVLYEDFEVTKPKYKGFQNWVFNAPADTVTKGYKMKIREIFYNILNKLYDDNINTQINPESYKIRKSIEYLQNIFRITSQIRKSISRRLHHFQRTTGYTPTKYRANFSNTIL